MRLLFLFLPILPVSASVAAAPQRPLFCDREKAILAEQREPAEAKKLGDLPPANLYLGVDRRIGHCRVPAVIRSNLSGGDGQTSRAH